MRPVLCALIGFLGLAVPSHAKHGLTLLFQAEEPLAPQSLTAMQEELRSLLIDLDLDWRELANVRPGESFEDIVVVKFHGVCRMQAIQPFLLDERGPLAFTHGVNGQVLPFSEVECDKIRGSIRTAMHGDDFKHADALLGRALGRVLAHEIRHVRENSKSHLKEGVNRPALTAAQLISAHI